ncbi:hypothetical protein Tco_0681537 [Tanacetum coccineum]|uniref:Uncharacterized protein n=1 Tax=Tanacetum coccineum TaxID=301880 RepID=A0ABQ4XNM0_9ASTR
MSLQASFLKGLKGVRFLDYSEPPPCCPPRQNVVPTAEKTDSSQQGLEFLFSPLLEEYYNPTHDQAEENNNDQARMYHFNEADFINPFCTPEQVDEDQTVSSQQSTTLLLQGYAQEGYVLSQKGSLIQIIQKKSTFSGEGMLCMIKASSMSTEYQLADMFTKALPEDWFKYLVRRIGMRCLTPADLEVLTNESA